MRIRLRILLPFLLSMMAAPAVVLAAGGAKEVVDLFLVRQNSERGSADAVQHVVADVNGDGRADIVLLWNVLGPTSAYPKLTLFLDQGKTYRALTSDLSGQTEKLTVKGSDIRVDTLMPGPNDARCCPSVKQQLLFRWQGGKLVTFK